MLDQQTTLLIEIPPNVAQQEVWDTEERLKQVEGVTTELQEPKDLIAATLLLIHIVGPYMGQAVAVATGIKATRDLAQILYDFLHPAEKEKTSEQGKKRVVIIKKEKGKEKRIGLYNLSPKEIEEVIEKVLKL
jgi:hypothetical protein